MQVVERITRGRTKGWYFMAKMILKRLLQIIPILLIVLTITFIFTRMIPGDPVLTVLGDQATPEMVEKLRVEMGMDKSIPEQYVGYIMDILHGDFGESFAYGKPVTELIAERLPNTLKLSLTSMAIAIVIGLSVGILSAVKQYSVWDYLATVIALVGVSMPRFWLALMLVLLFSVNLGILPAFGMGNERPTQETSKLCVKRLCTNILPGRGNT